MKIQTLKNIALRVFCAFVLFWPLAVPASSEQVPVTLWVKKFSHDGQNWLLRYRRWDAHESKIRFNGTEMTSIGILWRLDKVPVSVQGKEDSPRATVLWDIQTGGGRLINDVSDAIVDVDAGLVYLATAQLRSFVIYAVDLAPAPLANAAAIPVFPPKPEELTKLESRIFGSDAKMAMEMEGTESIKLEKTGDVLTVSLGPKDKPVQKWEASVKERVWKKTFPVPIPEPDNDDHANVFRTKPMGQRNLIVLRTQQKYRDPADKPEPNVLQFIPQSGLQPGWGYAWRYTFALGNRYDKPLIKFWTLKIHDYNSGMKAHHFEYLDMAYEGGTFAAGFKVGDGIYANVARSDGKGGFIAYPVSEIRLPVGTPDEEKTITQGKIARTPDASWEITLSTKTEVFKTFVLKDDKWVVKLRPEAAN